MIAIEYSLWTLRSAYVATIGSGQNRDIKRHFLRASSPPSKRTKDEGPLEGER